MKFLENLIYGFIAGLTEILPISSTAHQRLLDSIFGANLVTPAGNLFIHISVLIAVYIETARIRDQISKARQNTARRKSNSRNSSRSLAEYRFISNMTVPFLILFFLLCYIIPNLVSLLFISVVLVLNGLILFFPERMLQGNKNAKVSTKIDALSIGAISALSALPGFSRIGGTLFAATFRGADRKSAVNWALMLSVPALWAGILLDFLAIFSGTGMFLWSNFFYYILSGLTAFLGTRAGVYFLRKHIRKNGTTGYAYYCWGAALFALILFLTLA